MIDGGSVRPALFEPSHRIDIYTHPHRTHPPLAASTCPHSAGMRSMTSFSGLTRLSLMPLRMRLVMSCERPGTSKMLTDLSGTTLFFLGEGGLEGDKGWVVWCRMEDRRRSKTQTKGREEGKQCGPEVDDGLLEEGDEDGLGVGEVGHQLDLHAEHALQ